MTEETDAGWFESGDPRDVDAAVAAIGEGVTDEPAAWPQMAVETGVVDSIEDYYDLLHEATVEATRREVRRREGADDQHLKHSVRAMDDCRRVANELAERLAEWGGTVDPDAGTGVQYARTVLEREGSETPRGRLASRIVGLVTDADDLETRIEAEAPQVAPNLSALAGPVLAARLISLAGSLESLAKQPSGTVQVLGAEEALFAHLQGSAPSPKHGVIFTHEAVRGTRPADRGSAARALAGKLSIAARVDHYSGDLRPELEEELATRLERIRARGVQ